MTLFEVPDAQGDDAIVVEPEPAPVVAGLKLLVAYDGTRFKGFARQRQQRTVAGELGNALAKVLRQPVDLTCAGRTDAGVHAWGQVVSVGLTHDAVDPARVRASMNSMLGPEIVVREAVIVGTDFDPRFDARARTYHYTIVNRPEPDPFRAAYAWWVEQPLDLRVLRIAADVFLGEHDFTSFCRTRKDKPNATNVRKVLESKWHDEGDGILRYEIRATAFCWQMVRSIVGTLVDVGAGKSRPGDLLGVLRAQDRKLAGQLAPPHGLCLWQVDYDS